MAGITLVTLSQTGGVPVGPGRWRTLSGVLLAGSSAVCLSWISYRFKLGTDLYRTLCRSSDGRKVELGCVLAVSIVTNVVGIVGSLLIGLTLSPARQLPGVYLGGFISPPVVWIIFAGVISSLGNIAFRYANLVTTDLAVNAMQYLRPVLSLAWLGLFSTVTVQRADLLWIGATVVIAANTYINVRFEERV